MMRHDMVYVVYYDAGDYEAGDRDEQYYINKNGEYGTRESKNNLIFNSPDEAKRGVTQFLLERESKDLDPLPQNEYDIPILKGKWIIKRIIDPQFRKKIAHEIEFEVQDRKKKLVKSTTRKPIKKCKCKK